MSNEERTGTDCTGTDCTATDSSATDCTGTDCTATDSSATDSTVGITEALHELTAVSLADMDRFAALQVRHDRKYIVHIQQVPNILKAIRQIAQALDTHAQRQFDYESVYFDTPELIAYRSSSTRRPARFKVRTRTYLDTGDRF